MVSVISKWGMIYEEKKARKEVTLIKTKAEILASIIVIIVGIHMQNENNQTSVK